MTTRRMSDKGATIVGMTTLPDVVWSSSRAAAAARGKSAMNLSPPKADSRSGALMPLAVERIPSRMAAEVVVAEHYLHRRPTISFAFGLMDGWDCKGVVTFGTPASRHVQLSACSTSPELVVELNRLWVADSEPRNTESQFVAAALRQLPPRIVISYADTSMGHVGYIYRALNFHYAGWTDMERKTPRFDRTPVNGTHPRSAYRIGHIGDRVERKPKVRYWITTGNRGERKNLERIATWPKMNWVTTPPPPCVITAEAS